MQNAGYVKELEASGIPTEQAEAQVRLMRHFVHSHLAKLRAELKELETWVRQEIHEVQLRFRAEFEALRVELKQDIQHLRTDMRYEFHQLETNITLKLGFLMVVGFATLAALIHYAH